jgi:hypothetical protein
MKTYTATGDPRTLRLLEVNARYMRHETFATLVANIKRDGALTQYPFVWHNTAKDYREVLSGNHRVKAAIEAGLDEITWIETDEDLTHSQRVAIQLSHNAISGEDDPATLKRLYEELDEVDWKAYAGLDDKTLDLLEKVDVGSLSEANLDFASLNLMFLPDELESAKASFELARKATKSDETWIASINQYDDVLLALATVHAGYRVGNVATALGLILKVFDRHLEDVREGWLDEEGDPRDAKGGLAPLESIFGARAIPADAGSIVARAVDRMAEVGDVDPRYKWRAIELWAADYLANV